MRNGEEKKEPTDRSRVHGLRPTTRHAKRLDSKGREGTACAHWVCEWLVPPLRDVSQSQSSDGTDVSVSSLPHVSPKRVDVEVTQLLIPAKRSKTISRMCEL
jgi:hypothetical protein